MGLDREEAMACVGPGWSELIDRFYGHIEDNLHIYKDVSVDQVKEKFGTLRIYFSGGDDWLNGVEWALGWWSGTVCEECGEQGKVNTFRGWYRTQCQKHWDGDVPYDFAGGEGSLS